MMRGRLGLAPGIVGMAVFPEGVTDKKKALRADKLPGFPPGVSSEVRRVTFTIDRSSGQPLAVNVQPIQG